MEREGPCTKGLGVETMKTETPSVKTKVEPEVSYFAIEAYLGTTKHGGSVVSTRELIELCHITQDSVVLDVGCGVGATACYLVKKIGCRVVGVDIRETMVTRANERAERDGVTDRVKFQVADAQELPFEDGAFDAVVSESVALFVDDRQKALGEYVRVTKPGGYVGLNEEIWLKTPVPPELVEYMKRGIELSGDLPTSGYWQTLMQGGGLQEVEVRTYRQIGLRELSRLWRYSIADLIRATFRVLVLLRRPDFRAWIRSRSRPPLGLTRYLGYGLYVGRK